MLTAENNEFGPTRKMQPQTVSTKAILLTSVIDAKEQGEVFTVDILGAFMQGEQDEIIHMKLEGTLAELSC